MIINCNNHRALKQIWQCHGTLLIVTCSHVGHVFRKATPYTFPGGTSKIINHNNDRLAEVWMDEWKEFYYKISPGTTGFNAWLCIDEIMKMAINLYYLMSLVCACICVWYCPEFYWMCLCLSAILCYETDFVYWINDALQSIHGHNYLFRIIIVNPSEIDKVLHLLECFTIHIDIDPHCVLPNILHLRLIDLSILLLNN